jgi:hypothetical protein
VKLRQKLYQTHLGTSIYLAPSTKGDEEAKKEEGKLKGLFGFLGMHPEPFQLLKISTNY